MNNYFSSKELLYKSWETYKKNLGLLIGTGTIFAVVNILFTFIANSIMSSGNHVFLMIFIRIITTLFNLFMLIGMLRIMLLLTHQKTADYSDFVKGGPVLLRYLGAYILFVLVTLAGIVLLVVPGIIWAIQFSFYPFFILDRNLGAIEALKASSRLTQGHKWQLLGFFVLFLTLNFIGFLLAGIGLIISIPVSLLAYTYLYRKLSQT